MIHHLLKELECEYGNIKAFVYEKAGVILEKNYGEFVQNVIELSQSFYIKNSTPIQSNCELTKFCLDRILSKIASYK